MSGLQGLGTGLALTGGAASANAQLNAGKQAKTIANINAGQLDQNAGLLDFSANSAQGAGINAASAAKRKNAFTTSSIIARNAADGGDSTDKNVAELLANTSGEGEYNALNDIYEGSVKSTQLKNQAIADRNQATVSRYQGKQAAKAGKINAISTLLGSGSKAGTFYGKYGQNENGG